MSQYNYAFEGYEKNDMARATGRDISISTKNSIEICNFIRGKKLVRAKAILNDAIDMKKPIPFTRYTNGVGHKRGMAAGRFAINACKEILAILESAEINAQQKGLDTSRLDIVHICAQMASRPHHYGRKRGVKMKRTHIEIVLGEIKGNEDDPKKSAKKDNKIEKKEEKEGKK